MTSTAIVWVRRLASGVAWVALGKGVLLGSNAILMLLLAQRLPVPTYGLFATVIGVQVLVSRVLLAGLDGGMVRLFTAGELGFESEAVLRGGLRIVRRASTGLALLAILVWPLLPHGGALRWPLWAVLSAVAGAIGLALVDYSYFSRLARVEYRAASLVQSSMSAARLLVTASAVFAFDSSAPVVFLAYGGTTLAVGLLHTSAVASRLPRAVAPRLCARLLRYSVWQAAASITAVLSLYLGTFALMALGRAADAGLFGLALLFSFGFFALYNVFFEALLPRVARVPELAALPRFLGGSML